MGVPVFLGTQTMPMEVFIQIEGEATDLPASVLREAISHGGALRPLLVRYTEAALLSQIVQSGACNRLHPIDQRCARWLFLSHDRMPGDTFPLTEEFLSQMLGVRRATVTAAARGAGGSSSPIWQAWKPRRASATGSSARSTSA